MNDTPETSEDKNAALRDALGLDRRVPNDAVYSADEDLQRRLRLFTPPRLPVSFVEGDVVASAVRLARDVLSRRRSTDVD